MDTWDYECPQYVDFAAPLDNSIVKDDVFFDCDEHAAPNHDEIFSNKVFIPAVATSALKSIQDNSENALMSKMTAALSAIKNTPKAARLYRHQMENASLKKPVWKFGAKTYDNNASNGMTRSKSVADLNKIGKPAKEQGLRKRSSSLNDLKSLKKLNYPHTPMCLKRAASKAKKIFKSSEQIELEEIARLQKQMKQHLRFNELSLKKLNLKPKPRLCTFQKSFQPRPQISKISNARGNNPPAIKLTRPAEEKRMLTEIGKEISKKAACIADEIVNKPKTESTEKASDVDKGFEFKKPAEGVNMDATQVQQKPTLPKKIGFHSGLFFLDSVKKSTKVKPFNFSTQVREMKAKHKETGATAAAISDPSTKVHDGKENLPNNNFCVKSHKGAQNATKSNATRAKLDGKEHFSNNDCVKSYEGIQNFQYKAETRNFLESVKKIGEKRRAARNRGLSERN